MIDFNMLGYMDYALSFPAKEKLIIAVKMCVSSRLILRGVGRRASAMCECINNFLYKSLKCTGIQLGMLLNKYC